MTDLSVIHALIVGAEQGSNLKFACVGNQGYCLKSAVSLSQASDILTAEQVDVVVLALHSLPEDALDLPCQLRNIWNGPVLALAEPAARIAALQLGADCCLCPQVSSDEFDAQVRALMRCAEREYVPFVRQETDALKLEPVRRDASVGEHWLGLTQIEYRVLEALSERQGQVMERDELYRQVFYRKWTKHDRALDIHVSRIRRKLQRVGYPSARLKSVWRVGYALTQ